MHDLVVRGGTVIDGTGGPARTADVAVANGAIVAIGQDLGAAKRTIDADGALVTPGFVDIHAHYDGQASWDGDLLPSSAHGATTVVIGNCGVGFAPCRTEDRERLIALMEGVEDIPGSALSEGLTWEWETFGEYMDALDQAITAAYAGTDPQAALDEAAAKWDAVTDRLGRDAQKAAYEQWLRSPWAQTGPK